MTHPRDNKTRHILFLCRSLGGESLRYARAILSLADVTLFVICEQLTGHQAGDGLTRIVRVADARDPDEVAVAARTLALTQSGLDQIVTTTETLLESAALAGERLGFQGMSPALVRRVLDKSKLKQILQRAGVGTARDRILACADDARGFAREVGFPIILKPLGGSGGLATSCIRTAGELEVALELMKPSPQNTLLAEEYLRGREFCIDTITIANEPQFCSIGYYLPSILDAIEDPSARWSCIMPRDLSAEQDRTLVDQGLAAIRALAVGNAITHMEGFAQQGGQVPFTDATLRPAGARIAAMLGFACDINPYLAWARVAVDGCFDGPWERKYAVGTIFLRGIGEGPIRDVQGTEIVNRRLGNMIVECRLPLVGAPGSITYTGDGYITVRHPRTEVVQEALDFIGSAVRVFCAEPGSLRAPGELSQSRWRERLQNFDKLNRPAWDNESLSVLGASGKA